MQAQFQLSGLTCNHCKQSVESRVKQLPNVSNVSVDLATQVLTLDTDNVQAITSQLNQLIDDLGFGYEGVVATK